MKKRESDTLKLFRFELKKARKEGAIHYVLLSLSIITLFLLFLVLLLGVFELTGFATYIESKAGYVSTMIITTSSDIDRWSGFYGLVLRVPDFTQQLAENLAAGEIERSDVFF